MGIGPAMVVPAPVLPAPPFGLLAVADVIDHGADDEHWINGITLTPEQCGAIEGWTPDCGPGDDKASGPNRSAPRPADPFVLIGRDQCSTFSHRAAEYQARARRHLAAQESRGAEAELWSGALAPTNARLAAGAGVPVLGGGVLGLRRSLATLVQGLADRRAGRGLIHARPYLVELWGGLGLLRQNGRRLETITGHHVVAGTGYPGSGPEAQATTATSEWAFATDALVVHRGPVVVYPDNANADQALAEATDKTTNTVEFRAERPYAIAWGGCALVAVNVNPTTE